MPQHNFNTTKHKINYVIFCAFMINVFRDIRKAIQLSKSSFEYINNADSDEMYKHKGHNSPNERGKITILEHCYRKLLKARGINH